MTITDAIVDRFLSWSLPSSVCSDICVTKRGYPIRSGTNLLDAVEARQMLEYVLAGIPDHDALIREAREIICILQQYCAEEIAGGTLPTRIAAFLDKTKEEV
jgi:hypothetical protein